VAEERGGASGPARLAPPQSIPEDEIAERIEALAAAGVIPAGRARVAIPASDAIAALLDGDEVPRGAVLPLATSIAILGGRLLDADMAADVVLAAPAYGRAPNARKPSA